jgi:hypothetical protein
MLSVLVGGGLGAALGHFGNVSSTLLFFKNGKLVDRILGLPSTDVLKARLDSLAP